MLKFQNYLQELSKPKELGQFKKAVSGITSVDSRSQAWQGTLPQLMKKFGFSQLGSGKYGAVFGNPSYPYVIKVFMKDSAYMRWISFVMKNKDNPYVPKIKGKVLKITPIFYAIRLEKLKPFAGSGPFWNEYRKWSSDNNYRSEDPHVQEILGYFKQNKRLIDLHGDNMMMRGTTDIVIDPFYNWYKPGTGYTIDPDEVDPTIFGLREFVDEAEISLSKMKDFEKFVDRMFKKFGLDFEFTKHFHDRINDGRNDPKIKLKELAELIKKIYAKNGNPLKGKVGAEVVVKDMQSDLNMPIKVEYDPRNDEIDIVAKTIMRKKNFTSPDPVVKY